MKQLELIALGLPGIDDPSVALAAARSGATGVLDLELLADPVAAASRLCRLGTHNLGLRLDADADEPLAQLIRARLPDAVGLVVVAGGADSGNVQRVVRELGGARRVLFEARSEEEAVAGAEAGAHGVIAKGSEAGGSVREETTFVLLQRLVEAVRIPVFAQGGIGLHSAAACFAAGAAGAVVDVQLALAREAVLGDAARDVLARLDGSETGLIDLGPAGLYRILERPGLRPPIELRAAADSLRGLLPEDARRVWCETLRGRVGWSDPMTAVLPVGQDVAFAGALAERFRTVAGILSALEAASREHVATARRVRPLSERAPLAISHGTRYPIVQGPMTRVSDRPAFAARVADRGALPLLALALLRGTELDRLLHETAALLGNRPWGVGILGFVPSDLRSEQLERVCDVRPPYALVAGGRPDQALELEVAGIRTYLHVPSPGLLELFLDAGARRFVFEGRECGGHVGPRTSFVLWNTMVELLLRRTTPETIRDAHVLFAGGIHDAGSAAAVAALAAPLAEAGAKVGVLLGSAYIFTRDAVETGAIVDGFQHEALSCSRTTLLETGPGHQTRCAWTPYVTTFERRKAELQAAGVPPQALRNELESLNLGRLRLASKGRVRDSARGDDAPPPRAADTEEQRDDGMYMIGQVAALRSTPMTMQALHDEVSRGSCERLDAIRVATPRSRRKQPALDVAIVGIGCILPKAPDLATYWRNVVDKVDAITEVPPERWDWHRYYDADPSAPDKVYSRWGGFIDDVVFDPVHYGMPPASLTSIEPLQLLTLEVVRSALRDAGYENREFARDRASVILGIGGGVADLGQQYALRSGLPMFLDGAPPELLKLLPEWTEDSFAGILLNVAAGRVANRFDFGGVNYTVDAACASSLAAIYLAGRELAGGESDFVVAGGADTVQNPFGYLCFSKTRALSPRGRCRTFDDSADGIVISEGLVAVVLKRLRDAERDGDRTYAVIKAVAGSSDGRAKGLTAPRPEGQAVAVRRAYEQAGFSPATVGLVEAHGTGTVAGDRAEAETLAEVFSAAGAEPAACAIGSVKSMIGHTKCTAGVAGLAKAALALHEQVLPPTLHVEHPISAVRGPPSPFYVNTEARPWLAPLGAQPRRAAVSAFGFGGTNFHAVLEEHSPVTLLPAGVARDRPAELVLLAGESRTDLAAAAGQLQELLATPMPSLCDLSHTLRRRAEDPAAPPLRLAIVASGADDLGKKLACARAALGDPGCTVLNDPSGIYFAAEPFPPDVQIAFLFPGQGSQSLGMLRDLAVVFPEVREHFEVAERVLAGRLPHPLGRYIFPPPAFDPEVREEQVRALTATTVAQPALGAAGLALHALLGSLGVRPDVVAGHSYGEYVALCVSGAMDEETLYRLSEARGRSIVDSGAADLGTMAAIAEPRERVAELVGDIEGVWVANVNAPRQTVVSGTRDGIAAAVQRLAGHNIIATPLAVACAFHSPLVAPARDRLAQALAGERLEAPRLPVFANATGAAYPADPAAVRALLGEHLVQPVRFCDEVEAMHAAGARVFVEAGPRSVLTGLTAQILAGRPHLAVAPDAAGLHGYVQLLHALARLAAYGVRLRLDRLYAGRAPQLVDLDAASVETAPATAWLVNGGGVRPIGAPTRVRTPVPITSLAAAQLPAVAIPLVAHVPEADALVSHFHQLMNRFLDTQRRVMLAVANGAQRPALEESPAMPGDPPPAPPAVLTAEPAVTGDMLAALVELVAGRTGYPHDLIDVDADLEADLGLDSIKRVEILGALQQLHPNLAGAEAVERLTGLRTLRAIADAARMPAREADDASESAARFLLRIEELAIGADPLDLSSEDAFLVTDDGRGIASRIAADLTQRGARTELVDVGGAEAAGAAVERARRSLGRVTGVIHLAPLADAAAFDDLDTARFRARIDKETRSLFRLVQLLRPDFEQAAAAGTTPLIMAATGLGGAFASDGKGVDTPTHGAVAGLVKALAAEWPDTRCCVVDLDPAVGADDLAASLLDELACRDGEPEVGRRNGRRLVLRAEATPHEARPPFEPLLDERSVVLVTGGARGVTAELARELASYRPTLVLVGRSPLPTDAESPDTSDLVDPAQLRRALLARVPAAEHVMPAEIEVTLEALLRDREASATLQALAASGATVDYRQLDVRDSDAVARLVAAVEAEHGQLDAIVHGAAVIEDRLVVDKSLESFDRVLETKVLGALALARAVRPETLRLFVLLSSVAGRYGNAGQADYCAANDMLAKLALALDRRLPGRVVSLAWGPWQTTGMVSPELERRFKDRGVRPIPRAAGRRAFALEVQHGQKGEVEIVLGEGPWSVLRPQRLPLLAGAPPERTARSAVFVRQLDPAEPLLDDHRLDGRAVLPAAVALELLAEAAVAAYPTHELAEIRDLCVLRGVVLPDGPRAVQVEVVARARSDGGLEVDGALIYPPASAPSYTATLVLATSLPTAPASTQLVDLEPFPYTVAEAYERWLFQGEIYRGIDAIAGISKNGIEASLRPCAPSRAGLEGGWLVDPIAIDSAFQLAILYSRATSGMTPLPARLGRLRRFEPLVCESITCRFHGRLRAGGHVLEADISFLNPDDEVLMAIDGMEFACTSALNRLAGATQAAAG